MLNEKLYVSSSPHFRGKNSTTRIMGDVLIALVPAIIAASIIFGLRVLLIVAFCDISCVLLEYLCRKVMKRDNTISDLSALVTGTLLALSLPVTINLLLAFFGCVVAIVVAKQFFGGLGQNFINPAIAGRVAMVVSFPTQMTNWSGFKQITDAVSTATPRSTEAPAHWTYLDLFTGNVNGSIGETCKIAILIGFIYLTVRLVINPIIPVLYVGTVAALAGPGGGIGQFVAEIGHQGAQGRFLRRRRQRIVDERIVIDCHHAGGAHGVKIPLQLQIIAV
jgi:electron transport complex protein RnfD